MTQLTKTPRSSRRRPRPRQQQKGPLGGLAQFATGLLSSRDKRGGSKKGPMALALGAGAASIAVLRRRRSAAGNEPIGEEAPK